VKTNEEFLQGVYVKRDALVKKRKKRMAFTATAVCAALCITAAATAGMLGDNGVKKFSFITEIEQGSFLNKNGNESYSGKLNAAENGGDKIQPEKPESTTAISYILLVGDDADVPEIATEIAIEGVTGVPESFDGAEIEEGLSEEISQGNSVLESTTAVVKDPYADETTTAAPARPPKPTTQEIIDAAYNVFTEEERVNVIKETGHSTVKKYNDGSHEYEVWFHTVQDKYVGVRLDAELNPIPADQVR
jgi:hypothetical protein